MFSFHWVEESGHFKVAVIIRSMQAEGGFFCQSKDATGLQVKNL
jgi:hypothetical protein